MLSYGSLRMSWRNWWVVFPTMNHHIWDFRHHWCNSTAVSFSRTSRIHPRCGGFMLLDHDLRYLLHSYCLKLSFLHLSRASLFGEYRFASMMTSCWDGFGCKNGLWQFGLSISILKVIGILIVSRRSLWSHLIAHNSLMTIWTTCCFKLFSVDFCAHWLVHQNDAVDLARSFRLWWFWRWVSWSNRITWVVCWHNVCKDLESILGFTFCCRRVSDLESGLVHFRWWI